MKRGHIKPFKRLNFDGIALVPFSEENLPGKPPSCFKLRDDLWCVPGREVKSTKELIALADRRGLTVSLTENNGDGTSKTTTLN